jgi:hypothetical protein
MAHWELPLCNIKYITEYLALKLIQSAKNSSFLLEGIPPDDTDLTLEATLDSKFEVDLVSRISAFGYIICICGALISCKSKAGSSVTLSSTEAEYLELSKITKEVMFVKLVVETMGIKICLPIHVKVDIVVAISLSNNFSLSKCKKHIDMKTSLYKTIC